MGGFPVHFESYRAVRLSVYVNIQNRRWPSSSSISTVNCILLCSPLRWFRNSVSFSCPWGQMTKVSSTFLY